MVADQYPEAPLNPTKKKSDYIYLQSNLTTNNTIPSHSEKAKRKFLPLLFYYQSDYSNIATINPNIPISNFYTTLLSYANLKGLKEKLNGRRVEIFIDSIPHVFELEDKGWMVFIIVGHFGSDLFTINPDHNDMVVSYKIWQDNDVVKNGNITVRNVDRQVRRKLFQGVKRMTNLYLTSYDENIKLMCKKVVDQLMLEM